MTANLSTKLFRGLLTASLCVLGLSGYAPYPSAPKPIFVEGRQPSVSASVALPVDLTADYSTKSEKLLKTKYKAYGSKISKINDLDLFVEIAAETHNVPRDLILAIIASESGFRPKAVSKYGATGMMQVVPRHHDTTRRKMLSPKENILKGVEILASYKADLGSYRKAVQAYNVGITNYKKGVRAPSYLRKIEKFYGRLN